MKPRLIGLTGKAGSGKDTVASLLEPQGYHRASFAGPIKRALAERFGFSEELWDNRAWKELPNPIFGRPCNLTDDPFSPRNWAQWIGSDFARELLGRDCWVRAMELRLPKLYESHPGRVVITDVRFDNEAAFIRNRGGEVWRITRPEQEDIPAAGHISEQGVHSDLLNLTLSNDGTLAELYRRVNALLWRAY